MNEMNEYFIHQHRHNTEKNSKEQNCVDWTEVVEGATLV